MANTIEFIFQGKDDVSAPAGKVQQALGGLASLGAGIFAAGVAVAGAAVVGLGVALKDSVGEAMESQNVLAQLDSVLKSTGGKAGVTRDEVTGLANELQKVTKYGDETIISGQNMLLTFTGIGKEVFPDATKTMLDMSSALGTDLQGSAIMLGKALNDPITGVTALRRVGVKFTDAQEEVIKKMVESGDVMGAQKLILNELKTEFGGSAEAAGKTFAGQLEILKNSFGEMKETVGNALLPVLQELATTLSEYLSRPEVQAFIQELAQNIATLAKNVVASLPIVVEWLQKAFGWLMDNKGVIVAALAIIGAALLAFGVTTAIAAATAIAPLLPVIAIIAAIGVAAYLLYEAWTNNWGGIQEKVAAVWAVLQPILSNLMNWLQTNIPVALQFLSDMWTNILLPAIQAVWSFLQTNVFPLLQAIGNVISAVLLVAFRAFIGYIQNVTIPQLQALWSWFSTKILPIIQQVAAFLGQKLQPAFAGISSAVQSVIGWLNGLADRLRNLQLPSWLTPGSPTPFELGLLGIESAMQKVGSATEGTFTPGSFGGSGFGGAAGVAGTFGGGVTIQINYSPVLSTASRSDVERLMPLIREGALRAFSEVKK